MWVPLPVSAVIQMVWGREQPGDIFGKGTSFELVNILGQEYTDQISPKPPFPICFANACGVWSKWENGVGASLQAIREAVSVEDTHCFADVLDSFIDFSESANPAQILWDCTGKGTKSKELMVSHGKRNRRTSGMWKGIASSNCILILHKEMWARKYWDQGNPSRGVSPQRFWWGVWPEPWNLYPISGQHGKSDRKSCASVSDTPS